MKIFVLELDGEYVILNTTCEEEIKRMQELNAYELNKNEMLQFSGVEHLVSNASCKVSKIDGKFSFDFHIDKNEILNEKKQTLLILLERKKQEIENADILYKDKYYQADNKAKELLTQSLVIFSSVGTVPENFVWKSSDNSLNAFSLDDLKALSLLIAQRTQEFTSKYWAYKEQIKNANTVDELQEMEFIL
ncbi:DUF4376 domain-containing protein [Campylobacter canadensis]|uniref:DUF4376 domain-containing protein n=1 Tax=Campylobacter canadensis TaxID=449520 RepID=UPI001551D426|nr:DUF4376 domain-containing protein [Campylobacter canadensis]MBZ7995164.1 DUF4376 domain-containing protein [Campylobacter canadensis]MBZ7997139.1 DUF4376 domain-containing protein [Campylobacter canadensis]MBZ8000528.1 DUF4376 domain-containing protein [Campylobacter canadensis]MBZ8003839.1 DUF4376 domain-containing protein [Campylobacter canadensis]